MTNVAKRTTIDGIFMLSHDTSCQHNNSGRPISERARRYQSDKKLSEKEGLCKFIRPLTRAHERPRPPANTQGARLLAKSKGFTSALQEHLADRFALVRLAIDFGAKPVYALKKKPPPPAVLCCLRQTPVVDTKNKSRARQHQSARDRAHSGRACTPESQQLALSLPTHR